MFARLCQATHLVSKVLTFIRDDTYGDYQSDTGPPCDAEQICRTLKALSIANELEITVRRLAFCSQSVFACT